MQRKTVLFPVWLASLVAVVCLSFGSAYGFSSCLLDPIAGPVVLTPSFKIGYHAVGLNVNFPGPWAGPNDYPPYFAIEGLDAKLTDSKMWVASGRLAAQVDCCYLFMGGEVAAPRRVTTRFDQHPLSHLNGLNVPSEMADSRLSMWFVEGGVGVQVTDKVILFSAVRRDQLTASLNGPKADGLGPITGPGRLTDYLGGDLLARLWIPYVGLNCAASGYSASLAWSPFAYASVTLPWRTVEEIGFQVSELASYSLEKQGGFFEAKFDYDAKLGKTWDLGLWVKGTWMRFRGIGREDFKQTNWNPLVNTYDSGQWPNCTITRYQMALGLTASLAF